MVDKAVRKIKSLPKNRNFTAPRGSYRCKVCPGFTTDMLVKAWMHTLKHGPWPDDNNGTRINQTPLPHLVTLRYNSSAPHHHFSETSTPVPVRRVS